jgi:hypothetical protein
MRNNILGGLVIFMVVLTCLLMLDDISNPKEKTTEVNTTEIENVEKSKDLAVAEHQ